METWRVGLSKRIRSWIGLFCALLLAFGQLVPPAVADVESAPLSAGAREAAQLLGILPQAERLIRLQQSAGAREVGALTDEELALKVEVLDKIMGASLEVRVVADRIDRELAWAYVGQSMLEGKRQRNLNLNFTANFIQGGVLGVLAGPAFLDGKNKTGTELLLLGSAIGLGLSSLAILQARSGTKRVDGGTTFLADVYQLQDPGPKMHQTDIVLKFLNAAPAGSAGGKTRRQALIDSWEKGHYLRRTSETHLNKLAALVPEGKKYREDIGLLANRIRMLHDTQWSIEQLDGELLELLRATDSN